MSKYIVHDIQGNILRYVDCPGSMIELQVTDGESWIQGDIGENQYVDVQNNIVAIKLESPTQISSVVLSADGLDSVSILNLPITCTITIDDNRYEVLDGEFEFTTDLAGIYRIKAEAFPYLPAEWEVTAT